MNKHGRTLPSRIASSHTQAALNNIAFQGARSFFLSQDARSSSGYLEIEASLELAPLVNYPDRAYIQSSLYNSIANA